MRRVASDQKKTTAEEKKENLEKSIIQLLAASTMAGNSGSDLAAVHNNLGLSYFEND